MKIKFIGFFIQMVFIYIFDIITYVEFVMVIKTYRIQITHYDSFFKYPSRYVGETSTHCYLHPHGEQLILQAEVCRYLDRCVDARYQNDALVDPHRDPIWILCQWLIFDDGCASDPLTRCIYYTSCMECHALTSYKYRFNHGW